MKRTKPTCGPDRHFAKSSGWFQFSWDGPLASLDASPFLSLSLSLHRQRHASQEKETQLPLLALSLCSRSRGRGGCEGRQPVAATKPANGGARAPVASSPSQPTSRCMLSGYRRLPVRSPLLRAMASVHHCGISPWSTAAARARFLLRRGRPSSIACTYASTHSAATLCCPAREHCHSVHLLYFPLVLQFVFCTILAFLF
jgi:hypothetical protein